MSDMFVNKGSDEISDIVKETMISEFTEGLKSQIPKGALSKIKLFVEQYVDKYTKSGNYLVIFRDGNENLKVLTCDESFVEINVKDEKIKDYYKNIHDISQLETMINNLLSDED